MKQDFGFSFVPYHFGPYSSLLQVDIDYLIERGLLKEEPRKDSFGKWMYRYEVSERGKVMVDRILNASSSAEYRFELLYKMLTEIKRDINDKDIDMLLKEIYTDYPEYARLSRYKF